ncbi:MAG TPA: hypothetical protein VHU19_15030 [Pyrinomonadaceae bacterium]|jgi:hypothetical protein|nr:hypothetical protein [Pyrinomonadaceae bacterium]
MTTEASRDAVLLLTHSADFYTVELVAEALADVLLGRARRRQLPHFSSVSLPPSSDEPPR